MGTKSGKKSRHINGGGWTRIEGTGRPAGGGEEGMVIVVVVVVVEATEGITVIITGMGEILMGIVVETVVEGLIIEMDLVVVVVDDLTGALNERAESKMGGEVVNITNNVNTNNNNSRTSSANSNNNYSSNPLHKAEQQRLHSTRPSHNLRLRGCRQKLFSTL